MSIMKKFKLKILLCTTMTVEKRNYLSSTFLENAKYTHLHTCLQCSHPHKCKCTYLPHHCRLHHSYKGWTCTRQCFLGYRNHARLKKQAFYIHFNQSLLQRKGFHESFSYLELVIFAYELFFLDENHRLGEKMVNPKCIFLTVSLVFPCTS